MKLQKSFQFSHPITRKRVKNLRIVNETLHLIISGVGYCNTNVSPLDEEADRYTVDIESILYEGAEVYGLMEFLGQDTEIEWAAIDYVSNLFNEDSYHEDEERYYSDMSNEEYVRRLFND